MICPVCAAITTIFSAFSSPCAMPSAIFMANGKALMEECLHDVEQAVYHPHTVSEFKKQMAEVYTTSVSRATLDECPMAYKGMQDILDNIGPTADVAKTIRPIYNFKAGDED